jgi:hypothetical protein
MVASVVGLSILAFVAVIAATAMGVTAAQFGQGFWPPVIVLPTFGLPVGFLLVIALMVTVGVRRSREARRDRE